MQPIQAGRSYRILAVGKRAVLEPTLAEPFGDLTVQTDWAAELQTAATMLARTPYDVALVDFEGFTSIEPVTMFRNIRPDAKVILIADHSTPERVVEAIRSHAFSYFSRPVELDAIRDMIRAALKAETWSSGIEILSADIYYLTLRLRCTHETAERLVQFVKELPVDLPQEEREDVTFAFREMLLNAIEHGGKFNASEWVRVSRIRTRRSLVYHIVDPGSGFSRECDPAPVDPVSKAIDRENAGVRAGGFGLLIASHLVDQVIYNEQGNEVILIKFLD